MDGPIDVIRFKQQQENMKFLSHFGGKFIIHQVRWREVKQAHCNGFPIVSNLFWKPTHVKYCIGRC